LDFMRSMIQDGCTYTLPLTAQAQLADAVKADSTEQALAIMDSGVADPECLIFKVLDVNVKHKKLLSSCKAVRDMAGMAWPVRIQQLALVSWHKRAPYPAGSYDADCEGSAEVVDLLDLAPWPVLRVALRRWDVADSDTGGCQLLQRSLCLSQLPRPKSVTALPALTCLESLLKAGWSIGKPPAIHTVNTTKQLKIGRDLVQQKSYLQCLVAIEDLAAAGCDGVPSGERLRGTKSC
jgi:hypothetical protein